MSTALRLDDRLVHEAEAEAGLLKRTVPKQIEYWAEIGKLVIHQVTPHDLLALSQGLAQVQVVPVASMPINTDELFAVVKQESRSGHLSRSVTQAKIYYEASTTELGLLDQVLPDGSREMGHFLNGQFIVSAP
ncbi:MAG: ParD-like family protein [Candidatus Polarisedimenticolaceae bacterium]|nr:ParD-like family protein [Candidatus Polarisedimenticolaceae bacterium]